MADAVAFALPDDLAAARHWKIACCIAELPVDRNPVDLNAPIHIADSELCRLLGGGLGRATLCSIWHRHSRFLAWTWKPGRGREMFSLEDASNRLYLFDGYAHSDIHARTSTTFQQSGNSGAGATSNVRSVFSGCT